MTCTECCSYASVITRFAVLRTAEGSDSEVLVIFLRPFEQTVGPWMLYNNLWLQPVCWIGFATAQGVEDWKIGVRFQRVLGCRVKTAVAWPNHCNSCMLHHSQKSLLRSVRSNVATLLLLLLLLLLLPSSSSSSPPPRQSQRRVFSE